MKRIITPKVTICVIFGFVVFQIASMVVPAALTGHAQNSYYDSYNKTTDDVRDQLWYRFMFVYHIRHYIKLIVTHFFNMALYGIIVLETILLIFFFKLKMKSRTSLVGKKIARNSAKERRLVKSVIGVCVFFIITSLPRNMEELYTLWPGKYLALNLNLHTLFVITYGLYQLLHGVNHSFNLFVYIAVNSKFRRSFLDLFTSRRARKSFGST